MEVIRGAEAAEAQARCIERSLIGLPARCTRLPALSMWQEVVLRRTRPNGHCTPRQSQCASRRFPVTQRLLHPFPDSCSASRPTMYRTPYGMPDRRSRATISRRGDGSTRLGLRGIGAGVGLVE